MWLSCFFFFNDTATTEIYTLSLHDALPICFGQSIALDHRKPQPHPEVFHVRWQRCAAGKEGPEFPAEAAVDPPEAPHTLEELLVLGCLHLLAEPSEAALSFEVAFELVLQGFKQPRHGHQD